MDVLVYAAKRWAISTYHMLALLLVGGGVNIKVLTAPPLDDGTFPYDSLVHCDVFYLRLHGLEKQPYFYDFEWVTAFSLERLDASGIRMRPGSLVFMEGCYGLDTPFPAAFKQLGASRVIASGRQTENRALTIGEAGKVGLAVLRAWRKGNEAELQFALGGEQGFQEVV